MKTKRACIEVKGIDDVQVDTIQGRWLTEFTNYELSAHLNAYMSRACALDYKILNIMHKAGQCGAKHVTDAPFAVDYKRQDSDWAVVASITHEFLRRGIEVNLVGGYIRR